MQTTTGQSPYIKWLALAALLLFFCYWADQIMAARHFIPAPVISNIAIPGCIGCLVFAAGLLDPSGNLLANVEKVLAALPKAQAQIEAADHKA